jgi:hypothetical protein
MKPKILTLITAMALFATILAVPIRLAAQEHIRYTITDLGTLGGTFGRAWGAIAINNKEQATGTYTKLEETS